MALPHVFGPLTGTIPLSFLDDDFNALMAFTVIPTTASGANAIALTLLTSTAPIGAYSGLIVFSFVAAANSTSSVTINAAALGALPLYLIDGITQAGAGTLTAGRYYQVAFSQALNSGAGGFTLINQQVSVPVLTGHIGGMAISNDGGLPNTTIDISSGICADSTGASYISLGAFTKKTGGAWVAGTGNNGMGVGLTIANSTWYHVFAITNNNLSDVYFDTSVSAANKPASTTVFRRLGSFKTDGSAHIIPYTQSGTGNWRRYIWTTAVADQNGTAMVTTQTLFTLASVPLGIKVRAILDCTVTGTLGSYAFFDAESSGGGPNSNASVVTAGRQWNGYVEANTNTSQQIFVNGGSALPTFNINTQGWVDSI